MQRQLRKCGGFEEEVFTSDEIAYCVSKRYPERHFAARFAAKEAMLKALACGKAPGLEWRDMEIRNDKKGRPQMVLHGAVDKLAKKKRARHIFVSLAHTRQWALASVVLES